MSPRSRQPGEGQMAFDGLQSHPALVHMLTPEFVGVEPAEFRDITPPMIGLAEPALLRPSLIDIPRDGRSAVGYRTVRRNSEIYLAMTPYEFGLLSRHVERLGQTAVNTALASHPRDEQLTDEVQASAKRAGIHAVANKRVKMTEHLAVVESRIQLIDKFEEMSDYPNLNRGNVRTARERFTKLRAEVLGDMVLALGNQRQWREDQADRAERSIVAGMYVQPDRRERLRRFKSMLGLADEYYGHKRALIKTRLYESKRYIERNGAEA